MAAFDDRLSRLVALERRMAERDSDRPTHGLKEGSPGGTSGGVTDDWKVDVERRLGQLHSDVRNLLYAGLVLAGLIGGIYFYFNGKFEAVNQRLSAMETQQAKDIATLAGKLDVLIERKAGEKR